ncbi:hypothetical protein PAHAL_3G419100 [Panicum hallii]|uniref:Uncharacterized protein n=1 Tax=Panicum hallii TaxID=206008 RepID=A0A2T8KL64_9POAL|nr:hypothetical protein PAHAL_3G419100 [Panicum hallii]
MLPSQQKKLVIVNQVTTWPSDGAGLWCTRIWSKMISITG